MEFWRKYGVQAVIEFPVIKRAVQDFAISTDWTPAAADCKISKDGGNVANTTNAVAAVGGAGSALWSLTLTATEMQAARIVVQIVDAATKVIEDQALIITTYGHANATHTGDINNLDAAITSRLAPTVAARTLDVSAAGEAGIDWANIGSPTTTQGLSGTTVKTATDIATAIAALNNLSSAQANAACDTAIADAALATAAALAALNDLSAAEAEAACDAALATYDGPTGAEMLAAFAALENLSAADAADAVWDELISEARPANSFGQKVRQILAFVTRWFR